MNKIIYYFKQFNYANILCYLLREGYVIKSTIKDGDKKLIRGPYGISLSKSNSELNIFFTKLGVIASYTHLEQEMYCSSGDYVTTWKELFNIIKISIYEKA